MMDRPMYPPHHHEGHQQPVLSRTSAPRFVEQQQRTGRSSADTTMYSQEAAHGSSCPSRPTRTSTTSSTASIPISPKGIRRTSSENQLSEDEAMADYKDFLFYSRIVNGISRQNSDRAQNSHLLYENELCLGNIVRTRHYNNTNEDDSSTLMMKHHQHQHHHQKHQPHHLYGGGVGGGYPQQDYHHQQHSPYYGASTGNAEWVVSSHHNHQLMPPYNHQPYHQPIQDDNTDHAEMFVLDM